MNEVHAQIAVRREVILARIDDQRRLLARNVKALHRPLLCIELAASTWRLFSRHPGLLFGVAVAVGVWPRGRPARVVRHGWVVWKIVQVVHGLWRARAVSTTRSVDSRGNAPRTVR